MYSVVLMAALTAGIETPSFGHGCHGGFGRHGCHGGGGCYGSCYGGGCGGYGSCYGGGWSCYGGYGYGGCCGGWGGGCCGGWGGGCYGGWGSCYGGYGGGWAGSSYGVVPVGPMGPKPAEAAPPPKEAKPGPAAAPGSAKLIIDVPENAKVFVDDQLLQTPAGKRSFSTPPLERGVAYYYIFRAEVVVDGKTHSESKRVIVRAGDTSQLAFSELAAAIKGGKPNGVVSASR